MTRRRSRTTSRGRRSSSRSQDPLERDEQLGLAQQATRADQADKPVRPPAMLALQRTVGNAAATRLAPVQRSRGSRLGQRFGRALTGITLGAGGAIAPSAVKRVKNSRRPGKDKDSFESELFGRTATRKELETVAAIVMSTLKQSKGLAHATTKLVGDLRAADGDDVRERMSLLYAELYMHSPATSAHFHAALQRTAYLPPDWVQDVVGKARATFENKTAPAPEDAPASPMERIAAALEAMLAPKAVTKGSQASPTEASPKGASPKEAAAKARARATAPAGPEPEDILGEAKGMFDEQKDPEEILGEAKWMFDEQKDPEEILGEGAGWLFGDAKKTPTKATSGGRARSGATAARPARGTGSRTPDQAKKVQEGVPLATGDELKEELAVRAQEEKEGPDASGSVADKIRLIEQQLAGTDEADKRLLEER